MNRDQQDIIGRIRQNDTSVLNQLYDQYYNVFMSHFQKYGCTKEELKDIYQDTMIALYQHILKGRLQNIDFDLRGYVFGIGRNKSIDFQRKKKAIIDIPSETSETLKLPMDAEELTERQILLRKHYRTLGNSCKQILQYFYYDGMTITEIVELGMYKDENTVKSTKSRCIKRLREMINR